MKLRSFNCRPGARRGMLLIECLVYLLLFAIVLNVGLVAFYIFWDHSAALHHTTDDLGRALQAGEMWRADIRHATGRIQIQPSTNSQLLQIPAGNGTISYRFEDHTVFRRTADGSPWILVLPRVKTSQMDAGRRDTVNAWRWDVELMPRHPKEKMRQLFTFEAVPPPGS